MPRLLHGTLSATIYEVDVLYSGCGLHLLCKIVGSKLYATVDLDKARVGRTRMVNDPNNPKWREEFHIYCAHNISHLIFTVKSNDLIGATLIGRAYIPVEEIIKGFGVDRWVEILDEEGNPIYGNSRIHVKLQFTSVKDDFHWSLGIKSPKSPKYDGVPWTFFKQREGCRVTLYQDSHVPNDFISHIPMYEPQRCWETHL
ncbi:phospholipase D alpha 1 [Prunus yedoensis var. nudiflora]|uniref:Phospholipase D alpha 1 n=1 Tax=Prunus yedoensis var. nudiflora TaxID=2094558 RepID=A0A314U5V4_PRUYE|nr:phospholipase D alpha 1 [Prunus yedoensis var. nudiflora]